VQTELLGGESARAVQEAVELMSYERCINTLSDHKPVRAFLNLKVKEVDWAAYENSLINGYIHRSVQTGRYAHILRDPTSLNRLHVSGSRSCAVSIYPKVVNLRSFCSAGDSCSLNVRNNLQFDRVLFMVTKSPPSSDWLKLSCYEGQLAEGGEAMQITVSNDHTLTTLRFIEGLEANKLFAVDKMPRLSPFVHLPTVLGGKEAYCMLTFKILVERNMEEIGKKQLFLVDTVHVPVVCSLDLPPELAD